MPLYALMSANIGAASPALVASLEAASQAIDQMAARCSANLLSVYP